MRVHVALCEEYNPDDARNHVRTLGCWPEQALKECEKEIRQYADDMADEYNKDEAMANNCTVEELPDEKRAIFTENDEEHESGWILETDQSYTMAWFWIETLELQNG